MCNVQVKEEPVFLCALIILPIALLYGFDKY